MLNLQKDLPAGAVRAFSESGAVKVDGYQIRIGREIEDRAWDAFLSETPGGHYAQTALWAQVKASLGWKAVRITLSKEDKIVAGAQMLMRPLFFNKAVGYVPKGPISASDDPLSLTLLINELHLVAKEHRVYFLILQPPDNSEALTRQLPGWGFRSGTFEAFPTATVLIDLEQDLEDILANMKPQTRHGVRVSQRKGITSREGAASDMADFYRILASTAQRQKFSIYPEKYYVEKERILSSLGYSKLFMTEYQGETVSAMLAIPFGNTVVFARGGWSGRYSNRRPNELMHWAAIKWSKSQGYRYYDFGKIEPAAARAVQRSEPIPDALKQSVSRFKLGFGGDARLLPGVYVYVYNPILRWVYTMIYQRISDRPLIKKLRNYIYSS